MTIKVLSLVRFREGVDRDAAWRAWAEHTRRWDSRDHPQIRLTELTLFAREPGAPEPPFDGMAMTLWESEEAFRAAAAWYQTADSAAHAADLAGFLAFDGMVTTVIAQETQIPGPPRDSGQPA